MDNTEEEKKKIRRGKCFKTVSTRKRRWYFYRNIFRLASHSVLSLLKSMKQRKVFYQHWCVDTKVRMDGFSTIRCSVICITKIESIIITEYSMSIETAISIFFYWMFSNWDAYMYKIIEITFLSVLYKQAALLNPG